MIFWFKPTFYRKCDSQSDSRIGHSILVGFYQELDYSLLLIENKYVGQPES